MFEFNYLVQSGEALVFTNCIHPCPLARRHENWNLSLCMTTAAVSQRDLADEHSNELRILEFLKDEVDKSGELYLKVALWKVLLKCLQHYFDSADLGAAEAKETLRGMYFRVIFYSEALIEEGAKRGGLDEQKHGVSEKVVRENMAWLREKLVLQKLELTESRRVAILAVFGSEAA